MPRLRIKNGPSKGMTFDIGDQPLSIGRDPTCGIQVMDKGASRNHSEVFRIGEMCFIRDLESRNGTFINDNKLDEELLREGDRIQIGATILVFESSDAPKAASAGGGIEFSEEDVGNTLELRLEDLSAMNVDGSEAQRLRALYRLGRIIAEEKDEESLIQKVLPFVADNLRADCTYLFTRDPQKGNIVPIGTFSKSEKKGGKISRSIIRRAIQEKRAVLVTDAMQDNRFSARDSIVLKQIHSVLCVPLSVSGDFQGVLYAAGDNPGQVFTEEDLELSAAMADQVGLAISHLRVQLAQRDHLMSTIRVLVRAAEMRDPTTRGHSERLAAYSIAIGRQLRLSLPELESLQLAALLHDIGRIAQGDDSFAGRTRGAGLPRDRQGHGLLQGHRGWHPPPAGTERRQRPGEAAGGGHPGGGADHRRIPRVRHPRQCREPEIRWRPPQGGRDRTRPAGRTQVRRGRRQGPAHRPPQRHPARAARPATGALAHR